MKLALRLLLFGVSLFSCKEEIRQLPPPADPYSVCQPPPIEKNIIGTWHFTTKPFPGEPIRTGTTTFDAAGNLIDPDSLYNNAFGQSKYVTKKYNPNGTYPNVGDYTGKIFRVDICTQDNRCEVWPMYVISNECDRIVIYQLATYNLPNKVGFTLTR